MATKKELIEMTELLQEVERRKKYNKLKYVFPEEGVFPRSAYPHAMEFFKAGSQYRQRCFIAANRVGKTFSAACEMAWHLTGLYEDWWEGKKFDTPIEAWAAGLTNETTKDIIQKELFGSFIDIGSGLIPKDLIVKVVNRSGCAETIQTVHVKHFTNGVYDGDSVLDLKSYDQGAGKFQGTSKHVIWLDEEPPNELIKGECLIRTTKTSTFPGGIFLFTFTPLFGLSRTVLEFCPGGRVPLNHVNPESNTWAIQVTWDDVPHLTEEEKKELLAGIPPWMRDARTKGIPVMGSGVIYPVPEPDIVYQPFAIPTYWPRVYAFDVGWHKTAACWFAQDPDTQTWYLYDEYYAGNALAPIHAAAIKNREKELGRAIPGVIDPAARRSRDDGTRLAEEYITLGLDLQIADNSVESGITKVWQMLATGQLRVSSLCVNWFQELRCYHKDENGKIPDGQADHLMDCTRYFANTGQHVAHSDEFHEDESNYSRSMSKRYLGASDVTGY